MASSSSKGEPKKLPVSEKLPIPRPGYGTKGQKIQLLSNHFKVSVGHTDIVFHHYNVNLTYEDGQPVTQKGVSRKVIDKLKEIYAADLANVNFAYDGEKNLFTIGALKHKKDEFIVVLEDAKAMRVQATGGNDSPGGSDMKRRKKAMAVKTYKVELSSTKNVSAMSSSTKVLRGQESDSYMEVLPVLDIILRQNLAKRDCLLFRQSFFHNSSNSFELPGGIRGLEGHYSSFRPTQRGLSLNIDLSTTVTLRPGPVLEFLRLNQDIRDDHKIDWRRAKHALNNLRIITTHTKSEFKIFGLSQKSCREQTFPWKRGNGNGSDAVEVTVYDYFLQHWHIELKNSAHLPCLNVGKSKRPNYLPMELCHLVSLQRYTKALTVLQRSSLVEKSRKNPNQRKSELSSALQRSNFNSDEILKKCGVTIAPEFARVDGRVLQAPKLKAGDGQDLIARDGRWNFNNKKLIEAKEVHRWAAVNFSPRCDVEDLVHRLIRCGDAKGIKIARPQAIIEEERHQMRASVVSRVDDMFKKIQQRLPDAPPTFLLCVLPLKKSCEIYGPWKRKCLAEHGIVTQCLAPNTKPNDQYLTNVLLKINAKLGGLNSLLQIERNHAIPLVSKVPTIIFGMDVSHRGPKSLNVPSIAAVVSSLGWPLISRYRASVCTQPRQEMIDSLFKLEGDQDRGLIRELLYDFYTSTKQTKPEQIIIFRDGVSEGEFNQVLNIELAQIIEACKFLDDTWFPKFTVIIAQKNHHTRFFLPKNNDVVNVPPGTVVDTGICHPRNYDFYMCAHAGRIGTTRPAHYHVLHDEIGFSPDDLQELVHSLSYVYQRSTSAISIVAPVYYAHLAAAQVRQFVKFEESSETASSAGGDLAALPELPGLHKNVRSSMFFC
ncbi:hypothetical protein ACP4OV_021091 [Aristida adscensionis]